MRKYMIHLAVIILLGAPFLFLSCDSGKKDRKPSPPPAPAAESISSDDRVDVIRQGGGDWGYPTPFAHYPRGPGGFKMCLIFDSLLERDEKGLIPWLAESYEITDDGRQYVFTIRDGVKWQDGYPLTPEDVRFSLAYLARHAATWSYIFSEIEEVVIEPQRRVRVTVAHPSAPMLDNLGRTRIIPKHIWENIDNPVTYTVPEALVGSGPYRLTHFSKEHGTYRFEAFDGFWGPRQRVRVLEYIPAGQPILSFEKGEIDLISVPPDLLDRFRHSTEYKIVQNPAFWGYRLIFNPSIRPELGRVEIRRAFHYAVDLDELVLKIARGAALPGNAGVLPPHHVMYHSGVQQYQLDPDEAVRLLVQAGFESVNAEGIRQNREGNTLSFELLCAANEIRMAQILKERFERVGISLNIRSVDGKSRDAAVREKTYELAIIGHGGWGMDPDYLRTRFMSKAIYGGQPSFDGNGVPGYKNPRLDALLNAQYSAFDPDRRKKLIYEIQEILAEELPEIPLFYTTGYTVYRPGKYDGWMFMFDHHAVSHSKLSYLIRDKGR